MKKENLLVFDIDGTLLDSENVHQTGFVNALYAIGVESVNTNWESYTHLTDSFIAKQNYELDVNRGFSAQMLLQFEAEFMKLIHDSVTFKYQLEKPIDKKDIRFILEKNENERKIQPAFITIENKTLIIKHTFESRGYYDVHLYIKDDLISTYSFKVKK